jgi:hypothetical protein
MFGAVERVSSVPDASHRRGLADVLDRRRLDFVLAGLSAP